MTIDAMIRILQALQAGQRNSESVDCLNCGKTFVRRHICRETGVEHLYTSEVVQHMHMSPTGPRPLTKTEVEKP